METTTPTHLGNHGQPEQEHGDTRDREEDFASFPATQLLGKDIDDRRAERFHSNELKMQNKTVSHSLPHVGRLL